MKLTDAGLPHLAAITSLQCVDLRIDGVSYKVVQEAALATKASRVVLPPRLVAKLTESLQPEARGGYVPLAAVEDMNKAQLKVVAASGVCCTLWAAGSGLLAENVYLGGSSIPCTKCRGRVSHSNACPVCRLGFHCKSVRFMFWGVMLLAPAVTRRCWRSTVCPARCRRKRCALW